MPGVDWIPGVSHLKASLQVVTGDVEGAKKTMVNFHRECPGVSQVTSVVQLVAGDAKGALETQKACLGTLSNVADCTPGVGHIKGAVHHLVGDHEGRNRALNAATRTTVVMSSGAVAAVTTGGLGAIPAGIAAGCSYDAAATLITGEDQGYFAGIQKAIDDPSAGNIFDAAAIPVGDALAGYSGGKMGTDIAKTVKINKLEGIRDAKLQQMESVLDNQGSSGAALQLGREVNALTSEINTIQHGSPKYWTDPKSGPSRANAPTSVPTMQGYVDNQEKNKESAVTQSVPRVYLEEEDALYYDSYVDATITASNKAERKAQLENHDNTSPQGNIEDKYKGISWTNSETLEDLLKAFRRDPERYPNEVKSRVSQIISWIWLLLILPKEFLYTIVVQLNNERQGLYHSFIRHMNEWRDVIAFDGTLIERLSPLRTEIEALTAAENQNAAEAARNVFTEARQRLKRLFPVNYNDVQLALVEIQLLLNRFIQQNITSDNFLGRNINANGGEQLFFKVKARNGDTRVMVIAVSKEKFNPVPGDRRPVRTIITVFFKTWPEFKRQMLTETKEEMLNKRNK